MSVTRGALRAMSRSAASGASATAIKRHLATEAKKHNVIFSGIQPSGIPHLGNYLGFVLPFVDLQSRADALTPIYLSIVGLHAITLARDPAVLRRERREMMAVLVAAGVDPERTCLFFQEDVPEHTELAWVLNTLTPVGRLQRMTAWKSQLATRTSSSIEDVSEHNLKLGLLAYPVLQAADIMLYKATTVPVGEDQAQHLELSRAIAESFNRTIKPLFPVPEATIVPSKRILSLRDPSAKMSKSAPNAASRILLTDTPQEIQSKLKSAVTDSDRSITYDPENRPGISNLLLIWSALDGTKSPQALAAEADAAGWGAAKLKETVADVVVGKFEPIRTEYEKIRTEHGWLSEIAKRGRETASARARKTMDEVRRAVGLDRI